MLFFKRKVKLHCQACYLTFKGKLAKHKLCPNCQEEDIVKFKPHRMGKSKLVGYDKICRDCGLDSDDFETKLDLLTNHCE